MGLFFENFTLVGLLAWVAFIVVLLGLNEVTRRSKSLSIAAYCVLPLVLAALIFNDVLGSTTGKTWFAWVKVVSVLVIIYGFMLIRFTKLGKTKFAAIFPVALLSLNIAEAVYREFQVYATFTEMTVEPSGAIILGGVWNILNGIAGILCILTITGSVGIQASNDKSKDMVWPDMTWLYIVGYTLWNFAYVYNCISTRSMYAGVGILLAALIAEYGFKRGAWLQHRAQTLVLYVMFSLSFDFQKSELFQIVPTYNENMWLAGSIVSFVFNVGVFAFMVYTMVKYKKKPGRDEIFSHTSAYRKNIQANNLSA